MKTRNFLFAAALLSSFNVNAKTFTFKNPTTGQTMSMFCFFPNSISCQSDQAEVKRRLMEGTNPSQTTLRGARAADSANNVRSSVTRSVEQGRDAVSSTVSAGANTARDAGHRVGDAVSSGVDSTKEFGLRVGNAVSRGVDSTKEFGNRVGDSVSQKVDSARGKRYRVRVPGFDHTMTFHCHGGLESEECKSEKAEVAKAIREGSTAETLAAHQLSPVYDAGSRVAETTSNVVRRTGNGIRNGFKRLNHNFCTDRLARHASDFDDSYRENGHELVSYEVKMDYIKDKLVDSNSFDRCEEHYNNAVLGYQLTWISGGETSTERTHIYDGLGRLANGDVGYWKSEERDAVAPNSSQR